MVENKAGVTLECPKCRAKVIHNGLKISANLECMEEWASSIEDFGIAVRQISAALICKKCNEPLVPFKREKKLIVPSKSLVVPE